MVKEQQIEEDDDQTVEFYVWKKSREGVGMYPEMEKR